MPHPDPKEEAKQMLREGASSKAITAATGLSKQRISELRKQLGLKGVPLFPEKGKPAAIPPPPTPPTPQAEDPEEAEDPAISDVVEKVVNSKKQGRDLDAYAEMMWKVLPMHLRVRAVAKIATQTKNPAAAQRAIEHADLVCGLVPDPKPTNVPLVPIFALPGGEVPSMKGADATLGAPGVGPNESRVGRGEQ